MAYQEKLPSHCVFQSHTIWSVTFQNVKPALQNHLAENI